MVLARVYGGEENESCYSMGIKFQLHKVNQF